MKFYLSQKPSLIRHKTFTKFNLNKPGKNAWLFYLQLCRQKKLGHEWLGDYWRSFYARAKGEADNLRYILEHRYHSKK